jgi:hypothetical protein
MQRTEAREASTPAREASNPRIVDVDAIGGYVTVQGAARLLREKVCTIQKRLRVRDVPVLRLGKTLLVPLSACRK